MGLFLESGTSEVLLFLTGLISFLYFYFTSTYGYWKDRDVAFIPPIPFVGSSWDLLSAKKTPGEVFKDFYKRLKGSKYGGLFMSRSPVFMAIDPDFIKNVMIKDSQHFSDRGMAVNEKTDPLTANLFSLGGWRWRVLRMKLTPTFTSGKMKQMYNTMAECASGLEKLLESPAKNGEIIEIKEPLAQFTTDIIGTCAFGLQMNAMDNNQSEFRKMGRAVFRPSYSAMFLRFILSAFPILAKYIRLSSIPKKISNFFICVVEETVNERKEKGIVRNDMLQLMMEIQKQGPIVDEEAKYETTGDVPTDDQGRQVLELDNKLLAAQAFVFFLAGFETSSTTMSFALYELARNPDLQDKLAQEIQETLAKNEGKFSYDAIQEMKYLDMVISETLRRYPPVQNLFRQVTKPYKVPDADFVLPKGMKVFIPIYALHADPDYFPDPEKFDPERFTPEKKSKLHPMVYMPFGDGPRNCIGARFGLLQSKIGLATVLAKFKVEVCEQTPVPPVLDPKGIVTSLLDGAYLRIRQRD